MLIAANTGISAAIDLMGRIKDSEKGKRHEPDTLFVYAQVLAGQNNDFLLSITATASFPA